MIKWSGIVSLKNKKKQKNICFDMGYKREFRWKSLPHPPYSPDLAPSDFFLFPKLKEYLKGVSFNSTDEAKHAAKTLLKNQSAEFFKNGADEWKHCLRKSIDRDGGYVEKYNSL